MGIISCIGIGCLTQCRSRVSVHNNNEDVLFLSKFSKDVTCFRLNLTISQEVLETSSICFEKKTHWARRSILGIVIFLRATASRCNITVPSQIVTITTVSKSGTFISSHQDSQEVIVLRGSIITSPWSIFEMSPLRYKMKHSDM